jgi:xylulokinase
VSPVGVTYHRRRRKETVDQLLLGLDIGSSSLKALLVRPDGTIVATAKRAGEISRPRPGWAEQDADGVWWATAVELMRELLAGAPGPVAAVGVVGLGPCVLPADARGRPLRPAILYGIDRRAVAEIRELDELLGADEILRRCGSPLTTQAVGPKLLWLRRHELPLWRRTKRLFGATSYLVYRLTGAYVLDHHSASQAVPLYDVNENRWIEEWAAEVAPGLPLPALAWPQDEAGKVDAEAATATGLPQGIPVAAGTIDAWGEVFGSTVRSQGDVLVVYGTTLFLLEALTGARPDPRLWSTTSFAPGTRNLAAGTATAGALSAWFRHLVGDMPFEQLLAEAAQAPAGAGGLLTLPYFAGERAPLFDPDARGVLAGLTLAHGRAHVYRSLLEGTGFAVRHVLDVMAAAGGRQGRLVSTGGGTGAGGLWPQVVSNVTGKPQELLSVVEGAGYGAALLAGLAAGLVAPGTVWNSVARTLSPNDDSTGLYDRLYGIYRELYPATADQMHALAALQGEPLT